MLAYTTTLPMISKYHCYQGIGLYTIQYKVLIKVHV